MSLAEAFLELGAATLGESGAASMAPRIRAVWPGAVLAGPALTVRCPGGDNLAIHTAVASAPAGSVLVVDASDRPVAGAAICLSADAFDAVCGNVVAESGPDGTFEIRGAGDQGLFVSARAPGYSPSSQLVVKQRAAEQAHLLAAADDRAMT